MEDTVSPTNAAVGEANDPHSLLVRFSADRPLKMDSGVLLAPFQIAYQTYGVLNAQRSNAVLVCHALTGDQHVANVHPLTGKPGWWETMVGPGRPVDTSRYFVICANVLGGCMGTSGPASTNPATGKPWALEFPLVTVRDDMPFSELEYHGPAQTLPQVWMAARASLRKLLERITLADLVSGELPPHAVELATEYRNDTRPRY